MSSSGASYHDDDDDDGDVNLGVKYTTPPLTGKGAKGAKGRSGRDPEPPAGPRNLSRTPSPQNPSSLGQNADSGDGGDDHPGDDPITQSGTNEPPAQQPQRFLFNQGFIDRLSWTAPSTVPLGCTLPASYDPFRPAPPAPPAFNPITSLEANILVERVRAGSPYMPAAEVQTLRRLLGHTGRDPALFLPFYQRDITPSAARPRPQDRRPKHRHGEDDDGNDDGGNDEHGAKRARREQTPGPEAARRPAIPLPPGWQYRPTEPSPLTRPPLVYDEEVPVGFIVNPLFVNVSLPYQPPQPHGYGPPPPPQNRDRDEEGGA